MSGWGKANNIKDDFIVSFARLCLRCCVFFPPFFLDMFCSAGSSSCAVLLCCFTPPPLSVELTPSPTPINAARPPPPTLPLLKGVGKRVST